MSSPPGGPLILLVAMPTPAFVVKPGAVDTRDVSREVPVAHSSDLTPAHMNPPGAAQPMRLTLMMSGFFCNDCFS